jgi:hypothetical protein
MFSNRLTFAALAAACIAAAGVGGFFASRQNTVPTPASAAEAPLSTADTAAADHPVQETEAVIGDSAPAASGTDKAASSATPAVTATESSRSTSARATAPPERAPAPTPVNRARPTTAASSTSAPAAPAASATTLPETTTASTVDDRPSFESSRPAEPPAKVYEELVVSSNSVIGLQTETRLSSETARVEDRVEARVSRDVKVGDAIAIPAGSRAIGSVIQVERGGKFKERARLGIRFTTLVLADGTRLPMSTETIYREGEAPGNGSAAKIGGGAVGGAILGAILGGAKGAAIGATAGAGGGAVAVQAGDRSDVTMPAGSPLTVRLLTPLNVTVEQQ